MDRTDEIGMIQRAIDQAVAYLDQSTQQNAALVEESAAAMRKAWPNRPATWPRR